MDLTAIGEAISLFRNALGLVKDTKDMLPVAQQAAVTKSLDEADRAARIAEAQIAKALGFRLHPCTFPPQIMLEAKGAQGAVWRCPACGHENHDRELSK